MQFIVALGQYSTPVSFYNGVNGVLKIGFYSTIDTAVPFLELFFSGVDQVSCPKSFLAFMYE